MVGLYRSAVRDPYANSLAVKIYELLPNDTDYTVAKQRNIPGFNFAFIGRAGLYHSPLATPDAIELGAVQHMGAQALATTRALLAAPALPGPGPDAVFSDFLGLFVIAYPAVIGWGLVVLAAALVVAAFRGGGFRSSSVAAGLARGLGFTLLVAGLTWLANWLSLAAGKPNYYDRLAALPRLELAALAMALAALGVMAATAGTPTMRRGNWLGLALLNLLIAIVVQAMLPAAGPMLVWPVLLGLVAPALAAPRPAAPWLAGLFAVVALAMIGQGAHAFLLAIGITVPSAIAIFGPVTALLLWPLLPGRAGRSAVTLILLGIVAAAALALWVRLDPVAASAATYSLSQS
jgi:hypothetical protein